MKRFRHSTSNEPPFEDEHLAGMVRPLRDLLSQTQKDFVHDSLLLDRRGLDTLAAILVGLAEDLHCGLGLWRAYETHNMKFFGAPLPLSSPLRRPQPPQAITFDRVQHLLWVLYPQLNPGLALAPDPPDLALLAGDAQIFLEAAFVGVGRTSANKTFLRSKNTFGWDVKRKLIWLGTWSYLFRLFYDDYMRQMKAKPGDIARADDFLCQECTQWSGLGAVDILAGALDISDDDRRDLRSWYQRHTSFYAIKAVTKTRADAINVINDQPYRIRVAVDPNPFEPGQMVFGSLVPWRGQWYWSGTQQVPGEAADFAPAELREQAKRTSSQILCRFWKKYEAQVRDHARSLHEEAMAYYGKDLVVYPDGLSMAADWEKAMRRQWESRPREVMERVARRHGLTKGRPNLTLPEHVVEHKNGVGMFINPDGGFELMLEFHTLQEALRRRGRDLTEEHLETIWAFMDAGEISPAFVRRLVDEYGDESVRAAWFVRDDPPDYWLEYLLRRHKGHYFKPRYPNVRLV